jgi:cytochrome b561
MALLPTVFAQTSRNISYQWARNLRYEFGVETFWVANPQRAIGSTLLILGRKHAMAKAPTGYSATQISLHWAVVLLVAFQYLGHDGIEASWQERNQRMPAQIVVLTYLHITAGITVFLLASARVYLRVTRGVPPPPPDEPRLLHYLAEAVHAAIYLLLFLMPITGSAAWFYDWELAADAHEVLQTGLLGAIGLHISGALFQHFVLRSNVLIRMFSADTSRE